MLGGKLLQFGVQVSCISHAVIPALGPGPTAGDSTLFDHSAVMGGHTEVSHLMVAAGQTNLLPLSHAHSSSLLPSITPLLPLNISVISLLIYSK